MINYYTISDICTALHYGYTLPIAFLPSPTCVCNLAGCFKLLDELVCYDTHARKLINNEKSKKKATF